VFQLYLDVSGDVYFTGTIMTNGISPDFEITNTFTKVGEGFDKVSAQYQNLYGWKYMVYRH
jgi:hypothetical protein